MWQVLNTGKVAFVYLFFFHFDLPTYSCNCNRIYNKKKKKRLKKKTNRVCFSIISSATDSLVSHWAEQNVIFFWVLFCLFYLLLFYCFCYRIRRWFIYCISSCKTIFYNFLLEALSLNPKHSPI